MLNAARLQVVLGLADDPQDRLDAIDENKAMRKLLKRNFKRYGAHRRDATEARRMARARGQEDSPPVSKKQLERQLKTLEKRIRDFVEEQNQPIHDTLDDHTDRLTHLDEVLSDHEDRLRSLEGEEPEPGSDQTE